MSMSLKNCSSCGRQTKNYSSFTCPNCGGSPVIRCQHCRETLNKYTCGKCGNVGP